MAAIMAGAVMRPAALSAPRRAGSGSRLGAQRKRGRPMDSTLITQRIMYALDQRFGSLIDMSDIKATAFPQERRNRQLSRGISALAVMALTEATPEEAASAITDGHDDLGLDAIYFESSDNTLYVVQAKWSEGGKKTLELGDCSKYLDGIRKLVRGDFSSGNTRLRGRESEIKSILMRTDVRIVLVVAHTGTSTLGTQVSAALIEFIADQNTLEDDVFRLEVFDQGRVYSHLDAAAGKKIDLDIPLSWWGVIQEPFQAYYGQIKLSDVASWEGHGKALWDRNLRFYRGSTDVNSAMDQTITDTPDRFWYFNNGITMLCDSITKARFNGTDNSWGVFECKGVSIVNGAQTAGVIWERERGRLNYYATSNAQVHLRIISLENCPKGFDQEVTRATNTQNEIKHRDFSALSEVQHSIAREMGLDGKHYAFKSGDPDPEGDKGCSIEEATIARLCWCERHRERIRRCYD